MECEDSGRKTISTAVTSRLFHQHWYTYDGHSARIEDRGVVYPWPEVITPLVIVRTYVLDEEPSQV
jgi:hypothetical protein